MHNVLMIAFHFPPSAGSSGHLRTLALTHYLPRFGWQPVVLSAHPRAYAERDDGSCAAVGDSVPVTRAFALDSRKHLGVRGAYPLILAQPDRWVSWWLGAVPAGLRLIRRYRPRLLWSTYPIMSAHLIAYTLHRLTGIPWVADFRDPVGTSDLGRSGVTARTRGWLERRTIKHAARSVFTTPGAMADYGERYPERKSSLAVIPNGYDERNFTTLMDGRSRTSAPGDGEVTLVHGGVLYRDGRNPGPFFQALSNLRARGVIRDGSFRVILRASGHEREYEKVLSDLSLGSIVSLLPPVSYHEALAEQADADGLLLFQGSVFNRQIPAKVYEYLRIGRPIFALTDRDGDTAALLASEGIDSIAPLDDSKAIAASLERFLARLGNNDISVPSTERVAQYSRRSGVEQFANLFNEVAGE